MCINDWRIGSQIKTVITARSLAVGSLTLPRNPNRVGLLIIPGATTGGGAIQVTVEGVFMGPLIAGFALALSYMTIRDYGDLPTKQITLSNSIGTIAFSTTEFLLPTGVIAAGLNEFRRNYPGSGF